MISLAKGCSLAPVVGGATVIVTRLFRNQNPSASATSSASTRTISSGVRGAARDRHPDRNRAAGPRLWRLGGERACHQWSPAWPRNVYAACQWHGGYCVRAYPLQDRNRTD